MPKTIIRNFKGLNARADRGNPDELEFKEIQNAKIEANGNLKRVKAHDFVAESTDENIEVFVEEDGTTRELDFESGKTYINKANSVKLGRREYLFNLQDTTLSQLPKMYIDGGLRADEVKNSTFPSYGIPYNESTVLIPDGSGNFYTLEVNLELFERTGGWNDFSKTDAFSCYDSKICYSIRKFENLDFKSHISEKIFVPTDKEDKKVFVSPRTFGKKRFRKNVSFPVFNVNRTNDSNLFVQQYLNWDYCLTPDENTLYIVCSSASYQYFKDPVQTQLGNDPDYSKIQEVFKIIEIDISGDTIQRSNVYTVVNKLSSQASVTSLSSAFTVGFGVTHNGSNQLYIKGVRWSFIWNSSTKLEGTFEDSTIDLAGNSTLLYANSTVMAYVEEDAIYDVTSALALTTKQIDLTSKNLSDKDILLTKLGESNIVYLWVADDASVFPLNLSTNTIGTGDTSEANFPLYYNSGWVNFNNKGFDRETSNADSLINQTFIKNANLNGFSYVSDDIIKVLSTDGERSDFEEFFTNNRLAGGKPYEYDFQKVYFLAIGVRFNDLLTTPPINYATALSRVNEPYPEISFEYFNGIILSKTGASFDSVDEIFLFGNTFDDVTDFYFSTKRETPEATGQNGYSLPLNGLADLNYADIMGIKHSGGFLIYYTSICAVNGRTYAVGAKTSSQTADTLSQILYYTDGHPAGLNPRSNYILITDIINPIGVVGVQGKCFILGQDDVGFAGDTLEEVFQTYGSVNFNALTSNGDVAFYLHREGVMMVDRYRVRNISDGIIDPDVFKSMSDSEFKQCSGAIHGEYGLYVLSDPTNKTIYCFDIRSCYASFEDGRNPIVFTTKFDLSGTYDTFTGVHKLQAYNNNVYGQCYILHSATPYYMTVQLFADDSGEASHSWQGSGITQAVPFDNRNQIVLRTVELETVNRPKSLEFYYKGDATTSLEMFKTYLGSETALSAQTLPINTSLSNHKKAYLKDMKSDHFSIKLTTYSTNFELERLEINV